MNIPFTCWGSDYSIVINAMSMMTHIVDFSFPCRRVDSMQ